MAKRREVLYENGRYKGQYLDSQTCTLLDKLRSLSDENGFIEDLKHVIYDLPRSSVEMIKQSKSNEFVELSLGTLEDHQTLGVAYMYYAKRLLLGDSVGLGKTVETAGLCNLIEQEYEKQGKDFKYLMLVEKTNLEQIQNKMIQFTGKYVEGVFGEKKYVQRFIEDNQNEVYHSVVGSHSLVNSLDFQQWLIDFTDFNGYFPFDLVIIDESGDLLTNTKTQTYNNALYLANNVDRLILLNATSFEKELRQLYAQLSFVDDTLLPTKTDFQERYELKQWGIRAYPVFNGKYQNEQEFLHLVGYRYFSRTRKSTGAEMRDCTANILVSELSPVQKKLLKVASMPLMVYDCPSYFSAMGTNIESNTETTPKLRDLMKLLTEDLKDEISILVYARYKEAQLAIEKLLIENMITCRIMNGDTSQKKRNEYVNSFILGDFRVLVTNVQKGLDFGSCNVCIFYDFDPNPNKMVQFEGRMTREHDIVGKHVYLLISDGKEFKTLKDVVADRAKASDLFTGSDFSCVLSLLLNTEALKKNGNKEEEED